MVQYILFEYIIKDTQTGFAYTGTTVLGETSVGKIMPEHELKKLIICGLSQVSVVYTTRLYIYFTLSNVNGLAVDWKESHKFRDPGNLYYKIDVAKNLGLRKHHTRSGNFVVRDYDIKFCGKDDHITLE
ncbi:hypothetical protein [Hymenopteran arli-related virus OKIAV100]|uniref:Uncharacterized protein n=1 Tax=Hymenopteran arli-related virus OKIAV100 TaxID=2792564 RepID=A0A7T0M3L5_9MONO|nr:hypothetical protein [Hymenopteran arli-related virus OKIAV100]